LSKKLAAASTLDREVLFLQPTRELIDKTIRNELVVRPIVPRYEVFQPYRISRRMGRFTRVSVFATHQVLPYIRHFSSKEKGTN
jgi:hypothetical protein